MANPWDFSSGTVWFTNCDDYPDFVGSECQDESDFCPYVSAGQARKMVTNVTGLDHLEGETVKAQVDGILPAGTNSFVVTGATLVPALPAKAAVIHVGLPYEGTLRLLKASEGSPLETAQTKMRRIFLAVMVLYRSLGIKIGLDDDHLNPIFDTTPALPLYTGDQDKLPDTSWDEEAELIIKQEDPLPAHILSVITRSETEEGL